MSGLSVIYTAPDGAMHETVLQGQHNSLQQLLDAIRKALPDHAPQASQTAE